MDMGHDGGGRQPLPDDTADTGDGAHQD
jgi:hypothetical protein